MQQDGQRTGYHFKVGMLVIRSFWKRAGKGRESPLWLCVLTGSQPPLITTAQTSGKAGRKRTELWSERENWPDLLKQNTKVWLKGPQWPIRNSLLFIGTACGQRLQILLCSCVVRGSEFRVSYMLSKSLTTELYPQPAFYFLLLRRISLNCLCWHNSL